jgi:hypothetical protein
METILTACPEPYRDDSCSVRLEVLLLQHRFCLLSSRSNSEEIRMFEQTSPMDTPSSYNMGQGSMAGTPGPRAFASTADGFPAGGGGGYGQHFGGPPSTYALPSGIGGGAAPYPSLNTHFGPAPGSHLAGGSTAGLPRRLSSLPAMVLLQPAPETTSATRQRATPLPSCRRALEISRSATKMLVRTVVLPRRASRWREQLAAIYAVELVQHMFAFYRKWFLICS